MELKQTRTEVTWVNPTKSESNVEIFLVHRRLEREHIHSIFWMSSTNSSSSSRPFPSTVSTHRKLHPVWSRTGTLTCCRNTHLRNVKWNKTTPYFKNKKSRSKRRRGKIVQCKKRKDKISAKYSPGLHWGHQDDCKQWCLMFTEKRTSKVKSVLKDPVDVVQITRTESQDEKSVRTRRSITESRSTFWFENVCQKKRCRIWNEIIDNPNEKVNDSYELTNVEEDVWDIIIINVTSPVSK